MAGFDAVRAAYGRRRRRQATGARRASARKRLLVNWVYYEAVGHTIEAFQIADGFCAANPDLEIGVMVNAQAGLGLAATLTGIDHVYAVDVSSFRAGISANAFEHIPKQWDYLVFDPRHEYPMGRTSLDRCQASFREYIQAAVRANDLQDERLPPYRHRPLVLRPTSEASSFAQAFLEDGSARRISVLLGGGSDPNRTPSTRFWSALFSAISEEIPDVEFIILGASKRGASQTRGMDQADVEWLCSTHPRVRNAYDVGIVNQLALAQRCALHISPHTGMSFALQAVGVPWLVLSGGEAAEYWVNGVPFHTLLPRCEHYPCGASLYATERMLATCKERHRISGPFLCMSDVEMFPRIKRAVRAAKSLLDERRTYRKCLLEHKASLTNHPGASAMRMFCEEAVFDPTFAFSRVEALGTLGDPPRVHLPYSGEIHPRNSTPRRRPIPAAKRHW